MELPLVGVELGEGGEKGVVGGGVEVLPVQLFQRLRDEASDPVEVGGPASIANSEYMGN